VAQACTPLDHHPKNAANLNRNAPTETRSPVLALAVNVVPRSNALVATSRVTAESILTSADDVIMYTRSYDYSILIMTV
jgi:hypothetical protein